MCAYSLLMCIFPSCVCLSCALLLQLLFIAAVTPIMHDFYNYDPSSPEFLQEFVQFLKAS